LQFVFFGLTISSSWGNGHATPYRALIRALHKQGIRVVFYERDAPYYAKHRDFDRCDYCELVLYPDWPSVRQQALSRASASDVVVTASYVPEGARISRDLLELERPLHVFYDLDTPITLNRLQAENLDYLRADLVPGFDLYLSFTGGKILDSLEHRFGARMAKPLHGCVDPDSYFRVPSQDAFRCELSYMGTYAPDRAHKVLNLLLAPARQLPDKRFLLAGPMYPLDWNCPQNVHRIEHVGPGEHPALYSSSRATLNLTRKEMAESGHCPSGRFFEAAACETPLLTDEWQGLGEFFDVDEELFLVHELNDVVDMLALPDVELKRRAARARERTLEEHTGEVRARQLMAYCDEARHRKHSPVEMAS
jgi:spore maturation protein CgeB